MLNELSIKNFAIIESLSVSFQKGLTVLTGETGAGKSIIIDAINLLVGGRGSAEFVRHGEEKAEIEGLFYIENGHPCFQKMEEFGIDIEEGTIILRRDISVSGKSVCRINGKLITISTLREIGSSLIDIHGQHEHQELMDETKHLMLLDTYAHTELAPVLKEYEALYRSYTQTQKKLMNLTENEQQMAHRLDLLTFQHQEIINANLQKNEDEELLEERKKLGNFERIFESIQTSYTALKGEQKGLDWLGEVMGHMEEAASLDPEYKEIADSVSNSFYILEDVASRLRNSLDYLEYDPERLNSIESRLNEINSLKRKYGKSVDEILEYAAKIEEELETLQNKETHIDMLEKELLSIKKDLLVEANELSSLRKKAALRLTEDIHQELKQLYMEKTVFEVRINADDDNVTKSGMDDVEFYISTNPGEPLKPLSKIVSGGELSRMMLALKSIFSKHQGVTSIIFDEVDTGVSGRVAQAIAEKISKVAAGSQVLCISHMPQVAAMADTHLYIAKAIHDGRTSTTVTPLAKQDKVKEIARMISGTEITDLTKKHAKELLKLAQKVKNNG
ncbi:MULTISPECIES: DNA repair protein RecN [Bacillaceae]|uniref:DNA repair protein RecN n=1 Tax=Bacillaceae TaxID=186817 RepID=UPI001E5969AC|nr:MULTISPECIES: DNA repair protein RecN [Bacillaceae]MCE4047104.1 DNA repair protein RecN [Bacillus sp. Au-Bac7]MCM3030208.1 DNA repair protein RecN [Niallia sp. MER 6]MDL0437483.1 DNA repair protein RecN [Niallia sp. SS-2023]UPO86521.1 DNA repair protein RecN [Niallia sp. Man26]